MRENGCVNELQEKEQRLGRVIEKLRGEEAEEQIRFAISLKSGYAPLHEDLGGALAATGRFDDAINTLRNCLKDDPNNVNAMRFLAITYGKLDRNASGADALLRRTPGTNRCLSRRLNARAGGDSLAITRAWV